MTRPAFVKGRFRYDSKRVQIGNQIFDSKSEHRRWCELVALERAGVIKDLKRQTRYMLQGKERQIRYVGSKRPAAYKPDFEYVEVATGLKIYEDVKGYMTSRDAIRIAVFAAQIEEGAEVRITGAASKRGRG